MDPITIAATIGLLIIYIIIVYTVLRRLLSKLYIHWIISILLYIWTLLLVLVLPINILYEYDIYHNYIYPFMDWLIYTYGR